jgi:hypothetical protein
MAFNQQYFSRKKYDKAEQSEGTWIQNPVGNGLLVPEAPPTDATIRAPLFTRIFKAATLAAAIISQDVPNLLTSTLAPAEAQAAPFYQTDWANPTERIRQLVIDPVPNLLTTTLTQVVQAAPFGPVDYPNPERRREQPESLSSPTNIALLTPLSVLPFTQADWPNPTSRPQFVDDQQPLNRAILAVTPAAAPFSQTDWPNPSSKAENLAAHGYANRLPPEEEVVVPPTDATQRAPYYVQELKPLEQIEAILSQPVSNLAINLPPVITKPFAQYDWPTPITRFFFPEGVAQRNLALLATPFTQTDWPNPTARLAPQEFQPPNLLETTLALVVEQAAPFYQTDWLIPYRKPDDLPAIFAQPNINIAIFTSQPVAAPFVPIDFPNPTHVRDSAFDTQPHSNILIGTPSAVAVPFNMLDWPNPINVPFGVVNGGFINQTNTDFIPPPIPPGPPSTSNQYRDSRRR